jgi:hypothetical protein
MNEALATAAYALFALEQPIPLEDVRAAASTHGFPLASQTTPDWFANAADDDYDLRQTAPELLVLSGDGAEVDVTGIDLIHVYAPELAGLEDDDDVTTPADPGPEPAHGPSATPRTATQLGLLRELDDLDG